MASTREPSPLFYIEPLYIEPRPLITRADSDRDNTKTIAFDRATRPEGVFKSDELDFQTLPPLPASTLKTYLR